jgi:hypothetical protein
MAKYSNGSVAKLDDAVTDASNNGRNFVGRVVAVNDNGETGFITVVSSGLGMAAKNMAKMIPAGHINRRTHTFIMDDLDLALLIEVGPTSTYRKIFDPVPLVVSPTNITDVPKDNSFTAITKDINPVKRRKLVSV